ncbi:Exodeoxyribonuclease V alpha chain [Thioalkalivibrio nitratireducens DSM 14787]|uniref:RecBCD enzyme subunit RecD n=1 Tax=Thioalkalivibrio nitratireducens (strain DSM 14787 / UNIQEM 213 / ALEN2) TaxID=1255043 RepID=L0DU14_THIND|nr:exodeoxyribonuclease V subunit alpha [Thioalkalivibrio nitratireducens]AGA31851.1 Exodeoxyribonuclease V alpha chain [Thioalkalivibrio nitratireducens DSM 14787]
MSRPVAAAALASADALLDLLDRWVEHGWLRALDRALARFLREQVPEAAPLLLLGAALASHQLGRGHACLDLEAALDAPDRTLSLPPDGEPGEDPPVRPAALLAPVTLQDWTASLDHPALVAPAAGATPLVLDRGRLYLRRLWECEQRIAESVAERVAWFSELRSGLDPAAMRTWLDHLFGARTEREIDWQRAACALAAAGAFGVITGGPGTGKTTTVVRLLALLQALQLERASALPLRIRMAAPTGKAAARLNASVAGAVHALSLPDDECGARIRAAIPAEVSTVHRLLGSRPGSRRYRHHAGNPLPLDVLVVDEASMIDMELMTSVVQALPTAARLILLGDKDQLASVEAGAVLGEICARAGAGHYSPATSRWLEAVSGERIPDRLRNPAGGPLDQHVVMLRRSYRFGESSAIGRLARSVNAGDAEAARAIVSGSGALPDLAAVSLNGPEDAVFERYVLHGRDDAARDRRRDDLPTGQAHYLRLMRSLDPGDDAVPDATNRWAGQVLDAHSGFQLLSAVRRGPWGVETLNRRIEAALRSEGLIPSSGIWYAGRPVIVTANDYGLGLMNGDIGVTLARPMAEADGRRVRALRVAFPAGDGSGRVRWFVPSRLVNVETVYAMTVHKAQGSEFDHAALLLPERENPVLTRELLYTAITRARCWFTLIEPRAGVLEQAVRRRVLRGTGLGDALRGRMSGQHISGGGR